MTGARDLDAAPLLGLSLALGLCWALHDASHAVGLPLGFGLAGWATRLGVAAALVGGVITARRPPSCGPRVAPLVVLTAVALIFAGSLAGWLGAERVGPGLGAFRTLAPAYAPRAVGFAFGLLARGLLPAALAVVAARRLRSETRPD